MSGFLFADSQQPPAYPFLAHRRADEDALADQLLAAAEAAGLPPAGAAARAAHWVAAVRELFEETGIVADPGTPVNVRMNQFEAFWGEEVVAEEHFFVVRTETTKIDISGHEALERDVMKSHRWFAHAELNDHPETIYPEDIAELLRTALEKRT